VLRLKWGQYDGNTIKLSQSKGRRKGKQGKASTVVIPVAERLKAALDAELAARKAAKVSPLKIEDQTICLTSQGEAWQEGRKGYTGFIRMISEARKAAGIDGVSFGDLRGTAVTRLALAGCTVPEICAITGHSHEDATASSRPTTCTAIRRLPGTRSQARGLSILTLVPAWSLNPTCTFSPSTPRWRSR
jgi:integrase